MHHWHFPGYPRSGQGAGVTPMLRAEQIAQPCFCAALRSSSGSVVQLRHAASRLAALSAGMWGPDQRANAWALRHRQITRH